MRVIKIGGNIVDNEQRLGVVLDACAAFEEPFVLVHGGGKIATELAERLGVPQTMVDGRRITDAETLRIATMVYGGLINKAVVAGLQARGVQAVGLTGADGDLVRAHRRVHALVDYAHVGDIDTVNIDYGFAGDIDTVNVNFLIMLLNGGYSVVCAPLTHDGAGSMLNTNADTIAAELAVALSSSVASPVASSAASPANVELIFAFEHAGLLRDVNDPLSGIASISRGEAASLLAEGVITAGMLPKLENAFMAVERGVHRVRVTRYDMLDAGTTIR